MRNGASNTFSSSRRRLPARAARYSHSRCGQRDYPRRARHPSTKQHTRKNGATFGPYPHTWDRHDNEEADALLADVALPDTASCADFRALLTPLIGHAPIVQAINRMDRLRRAHGQASFTSAQVKEFVREAVRNRSRLGFRQQHGHLAMTVQRAKNREFRNVIVLWPHTAAGSAEHLRRLLYNGITRAQNHCTVIVLGQNRLNVAPFAP
ncbi:MAG: ATP-binding domain-containing protein [Parvibaculaceae bacterium]